MRSLKSITRASISRTVSARAIATCAALVVTAGVAVGGSAGADPTDADAALAQYQQLSEQASLTNEQAKGAQDAATAATDVKRAADAELTGAKREVAAVGQRRAALQPVIDAIVLANYKGARTNRTFALLVSDSPQRMLDQMSALDLINRDVVTSVAGFKEATAAAAVAQNRATQAVAKAAAAQADADRTNAEMQSKKTKLAAEIARIKAIYDRLTAAQRGALGGADTPFDARTVPSGSGAGLTAVRAALTRVGMPYAWGGTGPGQFDCSGLMSWAYQQAGKSLPRTSQAQLSGGTPVSRSQLQPGDIIVYYAAASHVGMYVGDGKVVHASTYGVPVEVTTIDGAGPFKAAVRF